MMIRISIAPFVLVALATMAVAQTYSIDWHSIDGGGAMHTTDGKPGGFDLSGTIGQPDSPAASLSLTGGSFEIIGGFWPVALACTCPGDVNGDGLKDGRDIEHFTHCILATGSCICANMDSVGGVTPDDTELFVADLLSGSACP